MSVPAHRSSDTGLGPPGGNPLGARAPSPASSRPSERHSRGYLPHFDREGVAQSLTFRLHDSIPKVKVERRKQDLGWRKGWATDTPEAAELRRQLDRYMDTGSGECHLSDPRIAGIAQRALLHFDGQRHRLLAWGIMPNQVHALVETAEPFSLASIVRNWKSYAARQANGLLGRQGNVWFPEDFDRRIRDAKHFEAAVEYVHMNPVVAGLRAWAEEWPWSSAGKRRLGEEDAGGDSRAPRGDVVRDGEHTSRGEGR